MLGARKLGIQQRGKSVLDLWSQLDAKTFDRKSDHEGCGNIDLGMIRHSSIFKINAGFCVVVNST